MIRRVLVTGATGFIGRNSLLPLRERDFDIHVVGRRSPADPAVTFHKTDLLTPKLAEGVVRKIKASHLLHLAWNAEPGRFWTSSLNLDWVGVSLVMLRAFAEAGGRRAVLAGTCAEYRWGEHDRLDEARTPLAPGTLYGVAKDALRRTALSYAEINSISVAWGRVFFLYGPGEKRGRLVSDAIDALSSGRPFLTTEGRQRRDFMHVEDVARAFVALLASDAQGGVNIGSGQAVPVRTVLELISRQTGGREMLHFGAHPMRADEPPVIEAATERLTHEVGFVPRYSLVEGLVQTVRLRREQAE